MSKQVVQHGVGFAVAILGLSACYSYVPVDLGAVPDGEEVRVYLTREGMEELSELPAEDGPILNGRLVRREADLLLLRVPVASRQAGFHTAPIGQNVRIPAGAVVQLERRTLDRFGTGLLAAGTLASAAAVVLLIMDDAGGRTSTPLPSPPESRVPLLSFPVP